MHLHKYSIRAVDQMEGVYQLDRERFTKVMYVCSVCGKIKIKSIRGWWSLRELATPTQDTNKE